MRLWIMRLILFKRQNSSLVEELKQILPEQLLEVKRLMPTLLYISVENKYRKTLALCFA
jgi:hypothetical protein